MNFEFFIASKISKSSSLGDNKDSTKPIIQISIIGIALGLAVMLVAISIVSGFQHQIRAKVIGFGSHIQVTNFDSNNSVEFSPISKQQPFYPYIDTVLGVKHIQVFATKAGIIKTNDEIQGVVLKGVSTDFDWDFFNKNLIKGEILQIDSVKKINNVLISKYISLKLKLKVGDSFKTYFIQQPPRVRKFTVAGIYETGLDQFDESVVIVDIKHIQKLNDWDKNYISGFEITLNNYDDLNKMDNIIYENIGYAFNSSKITDRHQDIFGWLELQDMNVIVIIVLMILVSSISMVSILLIMILEKTSMIGLLKSMGATNWNIRKIFLYNATYLIGKGLLWGNIVGIGLCLLQQKFGFITLPKESYYIAVVPIQLSLWSVLFINLGTFIMCLLMLIIPSMVVSKITPVKTIRFN